MKFSRILLGQMLAISVLAFPPLAIVACAANYNTSPNMGLQIPIPGVETGPAWAQDLNNSLTLIDIHDHTPGNGVQVPSAGLDINSNLSYQGNFITSLGAEVFTAQSGDPTAGYSAYTKGVDLYYKDGSGNVIQITSSGGVNGSPGSISNLVSPASASFVGASGTFVWQQGTSTAANMDSATLIIRYPGSYPSPSGNYIAIQAPSSLATGFAITLPAAPPVGAIGYTMMDTSGNLSEMIRAETTPAPTGAPAAIGNVAVSASSGTFATMSGTDVQVTNLSVTVSTSGRPVVIMTIADGTSSVQSFGANNNGTSTTIAADISFYRGSTRVSTSQTFCAGASTIGMTCYSPVSLVYLDFPSAGTYTYTTQLRALAGGQAVIQGTRMVAYEL